ncbi:hypothetical protein [Methanosarcina mazei]|jgi:hypothetical protein|uniref:Uncharacterized protein n=1 Tax=Methanosarcina mazei TaxID=2209 RepID=A0A0F8ECD7_METMZ|nr:hypothetical protein [Methanosarcina mazei]KKF98456.1 hypothetical protein DU31_07795 [Methanosarcina mazei]KKG05640.1 hypothetical protein DU40_09215 [Methanosarcina mazei]KKH36611.1 hypothetical protein DU54_03790 [Methanosarcina mazei]KKH39410.1 hypothetical protein DU50_06945 [Methanosarcina mazei]KKH52034.1 hypothetical protein DU85_18255 [Methanosarcina mazei]
MGEASDTITIFKLCIYGILIYIALHVLLFGLSAAVGGGILWGGGTALVNYGKSFKENMYRSNPAVSVCCIIAFISLSVWIYYYICNVY